jgi:PAS domain S-box-containing protein
MLDILLEITVALILTILLFWLWRQGKHSFAQSKHGWNTILAGFSFLLFGSLLDITDNFESLNWLLFVGDTQLQAILEKIVGYLGGFLLLAIGLMRWFPTVQSLADEINDREIAEQRLALSKQEQANLNKILQTVLDSIPTRVFWKDTQLNYLGSNSLFAEDAGIHFPNTLVGKSDFDLPWKDTDAEKYRADDQEVIHSGIAKLHIEEQQLGAKGDTKWVITNKVPLRNNKGELLGVLGTYEDITRQKQLEFNLVKAKEQAEQANKAKSKFVSSMSHELRTPLNAVLGFTQLLAFDNDPPLSKDQQESLNYIRESGALLLALINDVLDLSQIEMSQTNIGFEDVDVNSLIAQVANVIQADAKKSAISIINNVTETPVININANYNKLKQILLNFASNAVKYNSEPGAITFSCAKTGKGRARISVSDTGEGVPESSFPALFEPFNRLDKANSSILGTGIGLTICKKMVELMGGEIGVFNNPDKGLTFWVEFDLA